MESHLSEAVLAWAMILQPAVPAVSVLALVVASF
jgi:hypothetical protein